MRSQSFYLFIKEKYRSFSDSGSVESMLFTKEKVKIIEKMCCLKWDLKTRKKCLLFWINSSIIKSSNCFLVATPLVIFNTVIMLRLPPFSQYLGIRLIQIHVPTKYAGCFQIHTSFHVCVRFFPEFPRFSKSPFPDLWPRPTCLTLHHI